MPRPPQRVPVGTVLAEGVGELPIRGFVVANRKPTSTHNTICGLRGTVCAHACHVRRKREVAIETGSHRETWNRAAAAWERPLPWRLAPACPAIPSPSSVVITLDIPCCLSRTNPFIFTLALRQAIMAAEAQ